MAPSTLLTAQRVEFAQLNMRALVSIAPRLVMFIVLQRGIVQGVERAGLGGE